MPLRTTHLDTNGRLGLALHSNPDLLRQLSAFGYLSAAGPPGPTCGIATTP